MGETTAIPLPGAPLPMSTAGQPPREPQGTPEMRHAAEQFESMFLTEMLQPMFEGLDTGGLGGGGIGEEVFRPMLVEKYAEALAHAGGVGIAQNIMGELIRLQGTQTTPPHLPGAPAPLTPALAATPEADDGAHR